MSTTNTPPPELCVKFWPFSVTAKGKEAVSAIKTPLAIAIVLRVLMILATGAAGVWFGWPLVKPFLLASSFGLSR